MKSGNFSVSWLVRILDAFSAALLRVPAQFLLPAAVAVGLFEAALVVLFVHNDVMLYADGAYFVFALATGSPWMLKWRAIAARATVYVLTVWPVEQAQNWWHFVPHQLAVMNAVSFYGVPMALFCLACRLAWMADRRLMIFPLIQCLLGDFLAWGFPSELLLGSGLLWVALLLLAGKQRPGIGFWLAYVALVFTHELALPAALICAAVALHFVAVRHGRGAAWWLWLAALAVPVQVMLVVRALGGAVGSQGNALHSLNPLYVLANPTLFLLCLVGLAGLAVQRWCSGQTLGLAGVMAGSKAGLVAALCAAVLTVNHQWWQFDACRYDARTWMALVMTGLAVVFARLMWAGLPPPLPAAGQVRAGWGTALCGALVLHIVMAGVFLNHWRQAMRAELAVEQRLSMAHGTRILSIRDVRPYWSAEERAVHDGLRVEWVMPYRAFVLTDVARPRTLIYDDTTWYRSDCDNKAAIAAAGSPFQSTALDDWLAFACTQPKPPPLDGMKQRLGRFFRNFIAMR
ncbi:MAG TPA: hypothetical protein VN222_12550 [Novosphingobium sp.]|nr:hypothetical protein [Novosphingobium sp.]HZV09991.1 hypothetical protein [Novosphingobium sp.]